MVMQSRRLTEHLTVSSQLQASDFDGLARQGVRLVINNRPDGEVRGQLPAAEAALLAAQAGIGYRHIPITLATLTPDDVEAFGRIIDATKGPVHAHCASGMRSTTLWLLDRLHRGTMTRSEAISWATMHQTDIQPGLSWLDRQPRDFAP